MSDTLEPQNELPGNTEKDYLHLFNQRGETGLKYFFDEFHPRIYAFVFRLLRKKADSEEIVNDAFLSVFRSKQTFDSVTGLKRYLFATARNKCMIRYKFLQKEREEQDKYKAFIMTNSRGKEIDVEAVYSDLLPTIDKMSEDEKNIVNKSFLEGRRNKDIAKELNIPENTFATKKFRVLAKLLGALRFKGEK
ncbi:MAG TPA: sigma-70 family RNA polymerase sigma factor [Puia sp.]|jgi:RNA polymerase sigma-70 factor (ECF subfamily)|nr:sigma-70 family RNA polymerase sigma factor [Puia sp.]